MNFIVNKWRNEQETSLANGKFSIKLYNWLTNAILRWSTDEAKPYNAGRWWHHEVMTRYIQKQNFGAY